MVIWYHIPRPTSMNAASAPCYNHRRGEIMKTVPLHIRGATLSVSPEVLLLSLPHPFHALSTAIWGGGERMISYAMNRRLSRYCPTEQDFPGGSVKAWLRSCAVQQNIPPESCAVLMTSADVSLYSHQFLEGDGWAAEIIAAGGCEKTACRAGSAPLYRENDGSYFPVGTVNLLVLTDAALPPGILARALMTLTEGKTAAMQDLGIADVNNGLPATGTCTDGIIFLSDPEGPVLTDAGTFSAFGSALAKIAHNAVKECILKRGRPWNAVPALQTPAPCSQEELRRLREAH